MKESEAEARAGPPGGPRGASPSPIRVAAGCPGRPPSPELGPLAARDSCNPARVRRNRAATALRPGRWEIFFCSPVEDTWVRWASGEGAGVLNLLLLRTGG